jgi:hypothetical protein
MPGDTLEIVMKVVLWAVGVAYGTLLGVFFLRDGIRGLRNKAFVANSYARILPLYLVFLFQAVWLTLACAVFGSDEPFSWATLILLLFVVWVILREKRGGVHLMLYNLDRDAVYHAIRGALAERGAEYEENHGNFYLTSEEGEIIVDVRGDSRYSAVTFAMEGHREIRAAVSDKLRREPAAERPPGFPWGAVLDIGAGVLVFALILALAFGVILRLAGS